MTPSPHDNLVVVFDLGEVLASPPRLFVDLAAEIRSSAQLTEVAYWKYRDDHDAGSSPEQYWSNVLRYLDVDTSPELVDRLSMIDARAWSTVRPAAAAVLEDLASNGVRVALLSNAPSVLGRIVETTAWSLNVPTKFFSGDLGITKPSAAIYEHVDVALGVAPSSIVFFDDRQVNIDAAISRGWAAHLWTSDDETRRVLGELAII
jgi:putative hydrolase of the HAD superfamily